MPTRIVEGRKAPDFSLEDAGGKRVSTADFKGKDVIVYFYPKDDTPGSAPDGDVRKHWARVADAAKHPAQVLEQIRGEEPGGK